jgi:hypothetical protein
MKDSINEYMLPVRAKVEYYWNKETKKNERVCYVECANEEPLTVSVPFDWAQYIATTLNRRITSKLYGHSKVSDPVAFIKIPGLPMQKADSQIVVEGKDGSLVIQEHPDYTKSIENAALLGEELFLERWAQLPIDFPIMVTCIYNIKGREQYNMAQCNEWVLDLLDRLRIIRSKLHRTVASMDGSCFRIVKDDVCTMVVIRRIEK